MARNVTKYKCQECGTLQFIKAWLFTKAARVRCVSCGSTYLDPVEGSVIVDRRLEQATTRKNLGFRCHTV